MQDIRSPRRNPKLDIFVIFIIAGFVISVAVLTVFAIGNVVWVDFLHDNPNRSHFNAMEMIVMSPGFGVFGALLLFGYALVTGAICAVISFAIFQRVPLWLLIAAIPLCLFAAYAQADFEWFREADGVTDVVIVLGRLAFVELTVMIGCWWFIRRYVVHYRLE